MTEELSVHIRSDGRAVRLHRVTDRGAIVGRDPHADIHLDAPEVSRVHARIEHGQSGFFLQDLLSSNGTWLGETRVTEHRLRDGEQLRIGRFLLEFQVRSVLPEPAPGDSLELPKLPPGGDSPEGPGTTWRFDGQ